jgi:hypothetical protein
MRLTNPIIPHISPYIRIIYQTAVFMMLLMAEGTAGAAAPAKNDLSTLPTIQLKVGKLSFKTYLATKPGEQTLGLSNIKDDEFSAQEAMLFVYPNVEPLRFWMKETYFNLDIIFCDQDGKVIAVAANMPANQAPSSSQIPTTPTISAQYVLETKAGIYPWKVGMILPLAGLAARQVKSKD